jgi:hypothetical protein
VWPVQQQFSRSVGLSGLNDDSQQRAAKLHADPHRQHATARFLSLAKCLTIHRCLTSPTSRRTIKCLTKVNTMQQRLQFRLKKDGAKVPLSRLLSLLRALTLDQARAKYSTSSSAVAPAPSLPAQTRRGALEEHRSIKPSTYGVIFMGTPHQGGSGIVLGRLFVNVASMFTAADDRLLRHLERGSEWQQQQLGQYGPVSGTL